MRSEEFIDAIDAIIGEVLDDDILESVLINIGNELYPTIEDQITFLTEAMRFTDTSGLKMDTEALMLDESVRLNDARGMWRVCSAIFDAFTDVTKVVSMKPDNIKVVEDLFGSVVKDSQAYGSMYLPIAKYLIMKDLNGTYTRNKAASAFYYMAKYEARKLGTKCKDCDCGAVAVLLTTMYETERNLGNYKELTQKGIGKGQGQEYIRIGITNTTGLLKMEMLKHKEGSYKVLEVPVLHKFNINTKYNSEHDVVGNCFEVHGIQFHNLSNIGKALPGRYLEISSTDIQLQPITINNRSIYDRLQAGMHLRFPSRITLECNGKNIGTFEADVIAYVTDKGERWYSNVFINNSSKARMNIHEVDGGEEFSFKSEDQIRVVPVPDTLYERFPESQINEECTVTAKQSGFSGGFGKYTVYRGTRLDQNLTVYGFQIVGKGDVPLPRTMRLESIRTVSVGEMVRDCVRFAKESSTLLLDGVLAHTLCWNYKRDAVVAEKTSKIIHALKLSKEYQRLCSIN